MYQLLRHTLILFLLQLSIIVVAQNYTLSYRVLDNEDGLLGSRVISLHEDKYGFVWLSTQRGIGRYDGHQFKWFTTINSNLRGLPTNSSEPLVQDDEGYLWSLSAGQVDIINIETLSIQPLEERIKEALPFKGKIEHIKSSEDNYMIFKTLDKKWYTYHSTTGFKALDISPEFTVSVQLKGDTIWYLDENKMKAHDYKSNQKLFDFDYSFGNTSLLRLIDNYDGNRMLFWRFNDINKIEILEYKNGNLEEIYGFKVNNPLKLRYVFVTYLPHNNLFITNFDAKNKGLTVIDLKKKQLIPINNSKNKTIEDAVGRWSDKDGIIWARSKRSMVLMKVQKANFHQYIPNHSLRGLKVLDEHLYGSKFKNNLENQTQIDITKGNGSIWSIEQHINDELWLGLGDRIIQIDIGNYTILKDIPSRFYKPNFWTILRSKEGQWWAGTFLKGLFMSNFPENDSLFQYTKYNEFEELKGIRINHLLEDNNHIWLSTPLGLYLTHKEKGVVKKYNAATSQEYRLPISHAHFLYKDKADTYWLTTSSEGLIRFKIKENFEIAEFKRYTVKDGLSSNVLYSIIEDDNEQLWISTLNGISCFDKKTENIQIFGKGNGIQELEFNRNSYTKAADGRIFFGSINGATAFYPNEIIKSDKYDFPIYITQFAFYGKDGQLKDETQQVQQSQKIVLQPTERFFRLNVAMLDIFNSSAIKYEYKIEGLFDEFQQINGNTIEIGGLPYGRYKLRVRGQGADKRFSKQELNIPLIVVRPFYLKWWFILASFIIVVISIFQVYQWRVRQLEERKRELELLVLERTTQIRKDKAVIEQDKATIEEQASQLKELDELKSKFFANISHELRTPLTLILAPLNKLINEPNRSNSDYTYLAMMRQNSQKLLKRINELLDLSRLDANRLEVNEAPTFLYPFFKTLLSTVEGAANLKGIQLLFKYQLVTFKK